MLGRSFYPEVKKLGANICLNPRERQSEEQDGKERQIVGSHAKQSREGCARSLFGGEEWTLCGSLNKQKLHHCLISTMVSFDKI